MSQQHSWSAVERGNPPPRRKSCAACIKAKRRCTLDSPSCLRCTQRLIECRYPDTPAAPKRRPPRSRFVVEKDAFPTPAPSHLVHLDPSPDDPLAIPDVSLEYLAIAPDPVVFEVDTTTPDFFHHPPQDPAAADPNRIYHALPIITPRHDPPPRTPPTTVATRLDLNPVLHAITSRLQFSMDKIFSSINQMVLECGTPWCHPSIYQNFMPKVVEGNPPPPIPFPPTNPQNLTAPPRRRPNNLRPLHRQKPAQRPPHPPHHLLPRHRPPRHPPPVHGPGDPRTPPRPPPLPNDPHLRRRPLPARARLVRRPPAHGRRLRAHALPALRQGHL